MTTEVIVKPISVSSISPAKQNIVARFEKEEPESEELTELVTSIKKQGVIEPIIIRPKGSQGYEVIAGNRRLRAAKIAKIDVIPAIVKDLDDIEARRIAFIENVIRKNLNAIQAAKGIAAMYQDVGISKESAIKKVHRLHNTVRSKSQALALRKSGKYDEDGDPTPKFLETFNQIPMGATRQYQLLQLVTQLPEQVQQKAEETNLSAEKARLLTHSVLRKHPEVQEYLTEEIKPKSVSFGLAKKAVTQTIMDLESGHMWKEKEGYATGLGRDKEHTVGYQPEIDSTFDVKIPDFRREVLRLIGKLLARPLTHGEISYDAKVWKPKLAELKSNLNTVKKKDRQWLALDAAVLMQICKVIIDSAK